MERYDPARDNLTKDGVYSALELMLSPSRNIVSVRERLEFSWAQTSRTTEMRVMPPSDSSTPASNTEEHKIVIPVPLLTPRKGQVVALSDVVDGQGNEVQLLSHDQHEHLSKLMLSSLLLMVYVEWLSSDKNASNRIAKVQRRVHEIASKPSDEALEILKKLFEDGRLKVFKGEMRPKAEAKLFVLCSILAERYVIFARLVAGQEVESTIRFTSIEPNAIEAQGAGFRIRLRQWLGDHPQVLRVPAPLARRTSDYHASIVAPAGHYCFDQLALRSPAKHKGSFRKDAILKRVGAARGTDSPQFGNIPGAPTEAHIYIGNGSSSQEWIDLYVNWQEEPLGSAGSAWLASVFSAAVATALLMMAALQTAALPTINAVALLLTAALIPSSTIFLRNEVRPSIASRVLSVLLAIEAFGLAFWWIAFAVGFKPGANFASATCIALVAIYLQTVRSAYRLMRKSVRNHSRTQQSGW